MSEEIFTSCCQGDNCTPSQPKGAAQNSLSCISCRNTTGDTCIGPSIICPSEADSCASIYTRTKVLKYEVTTNVVVRGCGYSLECSQSWKSLSNQFMSEEIAISCCQGDNCTPSQPKFSTNILAPNGLKCPNCFSLTSKCEPEDTTQCMGEENKCVSFLSRSFSGEHMTSMISMSGCATENFCTNYSGNATESSTGERTITSISCKNDTTSSVIGSTTVSQDHEMKKTVVSTTGHSFSCVSCTSTSGDTCNGSTIICPPYSDSCASIYTKSKFLKYGVATNVVVRGCGYSSECAQSWKRLSNQFMSEEIAISCCQGDNCTPNQPKILTNTSVPNGKMCPTCFSQTLTCHPEGITQCTGEENECISYSVKKTTAGQTSLQFSAFGCSTENFCSNYISISTSNTSGETGIYTSCGSVKTTNITGHHNNGNKMTHVSIFVLLIGFLIQ
ncbi:Hypothetical predicted protein [Pelobates cultripes]|nr:Hypothetical predicted protein [Pelobates cultripes]